MGKITSKDISNAAAKLRKSSEEAECYICHKPKCDGYQSVVVKIHVKCAEGVKRKIDRVFGLFKA